MKHKTLAKVAIGMLIVYGLTVLLYPMLYNPDSKDRAVEAPPIEKPITTN